MERERAIKQLRELRKGGKKMRLAGEGWNKPWKLLITTILSARSRDETTIPVATNLFKKYGTVKKLANAKLGDVQRAIRSINFYRNKSRMIVNCAKVLDKEYKGKPPKDMEKLIKLPGVGRKTANIFLTESEGRAAIPIDTHCLYISKKLGWTNSDKPEKVEKDLERLFPKSYWRKVNPILVRFGKTHTSRRKKDKLLAEIKKIR